MQWSVSSVYGTSHHSDYSRTIQQGILCHRRYLHQWSLPAARRRTWHWPVFASAPVFLNLQYSAWSLFQHSHWHSCTDVNTMASLQLTNLGMLRIYERFSVATKHALSNFTCNFSLSSYPSLLKAWAMGVDDEGPRPADLEHCFFRSVIAWAHWSFRAWLWTLLICTEWVPTIQLSLKFFLPLICPQTQCKLCISAWLPPCSHLDPLCCSRAMSSFGVRDLDCAATSGRYWQHKFTCQTDDLGLIGHAYWPCVKMVGHSK